MVDGLKQVEASRFKVGENHAPWSLILVCYQMGADYCFVVFDEDDKREYIQSSIVSPRTTNDLEQSILDVLQNPAGLERLGDVFDRLQRGFYGPLFEMRNTED